MHPVSNQGHVQPHHVTVITLLCLHEYISCRVHSCMIEKHVFDASVQYPLLVDHTM